MGELSFNTAPFGPGGVAGLLSVRSIFAWSSCGLVLVFVLSWSSSGLGVVLVLVWSWSWLGLDFLFSVSLSLSPSFLDSLIPSEKARDRKREPDKQVSCPPLSRGCPMAAHAIGICFQGVIVGLAVHMRPAHPLLVFLAPHQDALLLDEVAPRTHGPMV